MKGEEARSTHRAAGLVQLAQLGPDERCNLSPQKGGHGHWYTQILQTIIVQWILCYWF
jgi:hypothetical protein